MTDVTLVVTPPPTVQLTATTTGAPGPPGGAGPEGPEGPQGPPGSITNGTIDGGNF